MYHSMFMQLLEYCKYDYNISICILFIALVICIMLMIIEEYIEKRRITKDI